jgi:type IV pilus assembly protein PilZ
MPARDPILLLASGIAWRLEQVQEALGQLRRGLSPQQVPKITVGYQPAHDRLVIVLTMGPRGGDHVGPVAVAEARLEGLRVVQLAQKGDVEREALAGCAVVAELGDAAKVVARFREVGRRKAEPAAAAAPEQDPRRKDPRVNTRLEVAFTTGEQVAREYTENVSRGGIFVRTDTPPLRGTAIDLTLRLPGGEELAVTAEVVHVVDPAQAAQLGTPAGCGLSFRGLDRSVREKLEAFVEVKLAPPAGTVLLVEPDLGRRTQMGLALQAQGLTVAEASTLASGWSRFGEKQLELVLLILAAELPDGTGDELLTRIRDVAGELDLCTVVLEDRSDARTRARHLLTGADEVLQRTLPASTLAERALQALRDRQAPAGTSSSERIAPKR